MRFKHIGVSLLLILDAAHALAEPGAYRRDGRDTVRAYFLQNTTVERGEQRNEQQSQRPSERFRGRESGLPDSSGYSAPGEPNSSSNSSSELNRRQGRLTPEERRALRRQIDEAGHDIYSPKR